MQLLIGYLVALTVFLGGGYAGVQWLLTPDDPAAALAEKSRPESATARLINAKKIRDARAHNRKLAETLAGEGDKLPLADKESSAQKEPPAQKEPDVVVADGVDHSARIADRPANRVAAVVSQDVATPQVSETAVAANDPKLDARAEVNSVTPQKIKAVQNQPYVVQRPARKTDAESVGARNAIEIKTEPAAGRSEAATNKKQAVSKKKRVEKVASSSRKPVMMILRTIEFPDGRREQRLLPMSQARAGLVRYGSISAFAGDDDF